MTRLNSSVYIIYTHVLANIRALTVHITGRVIKTHIIFTRRLKNKLFRIIYIYNVAERYFGTKSLLYLVRIWDRF